MNKILFLFLALILVACSPQVTVTSEVTVTLTSLLTETPIPTPTLHPDFVALQNLISDSSNLVLLPDGTIENNGIPIPNLYIDQNGVINIIFNNEHVAIEATQISFNDDNGLTIEGYEQDENGEWVDATSEAMRTMQEDFGKYNASLEQFTVTEEGDNLVITNPETGEIVYQNDSFNPLFLGRLIVKNNMCQVTEWTSSKIGNTWPSSNVNEFRDKYLLSVMKTYGLLVENRTIKGSGSLMLPYHLGGGCWGIVRSFDEHSNGWFFWKNENGSRVFWEQVDLSLSKK